MPLGGLAFEPDLNFTLSGRFLKLPQIAADRQLCRAAIEACVSLLVRIADDLQSAIQGYAAPRIFGKGCNVDGSREYDARGAGKDLYDGSVFFNPKRDAIGQIFGFIQFAARRRFGRFRTSLFAIGHFP